MNDDLAQIADQIVLKKIRQGCKFIIKGTVYANELMQEIHNALISERQRCLSILDDEGWLGASRSKIENGSSE